jgi:hypothetical protein
MFNYKNIKGILNNQEATDKNKNNQKNYVNIIDPTLLNYITRLQNEKDKPRRMQTLNDINSSGEQGSSLFNGLNDNIHVDADKKYKARRSLLYLLNVMSGGTFCPEINEHFRKEREKKNEKNENNNTNNNNIPTNTITSTKPDILIKNPITRLKSLKNQLLSNANVNNKNLQERFQYNFKKRDNKKIEEKDEEENITKNFEKDIGLKEYEKYYSIEEIENTSLNKFKFNKQALARKKLNKKEILKKNKNIRDNIINNNGGINNKEKNNKNLFLKLNNNNNNNNVNSSSNKLAQINEINEVKENKEENSSDSINKE